MTKETGHTPTPWRIGDAGHTIFGPPNGNPSPKTIATLPKIKIPCKVADIDESIANAAFIVRACNAHEELVRQLESAREFIMRFDESDDDEIAMARSISETLNKATGE